MTEKLETTQKARIYLAPLDGLRFVAFVLVSFHHAGPPQGSALLNDISVRGWMGVDLFFVISSFLFFTLFRAEFDRTERIDVRNFFIRRLLRIYPLMIAAPIAMMALTWGTYDLSQALRELGQIAFFADNLFYLPGFARAIPYMGHLWTLSFEFQIYLVLPALFIASARLRTAHALLLLGVIWAAAICARSYYALASTPHPLIYLSPWLRPDSIIVGLAIALVIPKGHIRIAGGALVAAGLFIALLPNVDIAGWTNIPLFVAVAVASGALLWLCLCWQRASNVLSHPSMVYLGKISFGLYVVHVPILAGVQWALLSLPGLPPPVYWTVMYLGTLGCSTLVAAIIYRYFERPFLLIKDRHAAVLSRAA